MCSNENDPLKPDTSPTTWTAEDEEPWEAGEAAVYWPEEDEEDEDGWIEEEEDEDEDEWSEEEDFEDDYWACDLPEEKVTMLETVKRVLKNKWVLVIVLGLAALLGGGTYSNQIKDLLLSILGG